MEQQHSKEMASSQLPSGWLAPSSATTLLGTAFVCCLQECAVPHLQEGFHAARTVPPLWTSAPLGLQGQSGCIPSPGCDLLLLPVQSDASCAFGVEPLRAPVALTAAVPGICSQFSQPVWRLLGLESPLAVPACALCVLRLCTLCVAGQACCQLCLPQLPPFSCSRR